MCDAGLALSIGESMALSYRIVISLLPDKYIIILIEIEIKETSSLRGSEKNIVLEVF